MNVSPVPLLVGWNVPDVVNVVGMADAAASSRRRLRLVTALVPPTSDMMIAFCPPGPTSKTSTSLGNV